MSDCNKNFELLLFAVSEKARGCGVGSQLFARAKDYLISQGATKAFLFTDTSCTWQYYEKRGMRRAACLDFGEENKDGLASSMFIYEFEL